MKHPVDPTPTGSGDGSPRRLLKVGAHEVSLYSLQAEMDAAYDNLFAQALGGGTIQWSDFCLAVESFLRTCPSPAAMDSFFSNATPLWTLLMEAGRYEAADGYWARVVGSVTASEKVVGLPPVHKGSGYYFWASNALHRGDVDRGLLLMHEALVEDARTCRTPAPAWPPTPATKVVSLDAELLGTHPASWWVADQAGAIDAALEKFGTKLRTADIRKRFFLATDPASVFLFVYAHASLLRLERTPPEHRDNEFVGRLALGHLFHLAIVIERAIKKQSARQGKHDLFMAQAEELSKNLGGKLKDALPGGGGPSHASDINTQQQVDSDATLRRLLAATATYGGSEVLTVDRPLCIAYVLRNLGGHESAAPAVVSEQIGDLRVLMIGVLAQCVAVYYP